MAGLRLVMPKRIVAQLVVAALGFAVAYVALVLVPCVHREAMSLRKVLGELRLSNQPA